MIMAKQELYSEYLLESIKVGKLDALFSRADLNTLTNLIQSKIFNYINQLLLIWQTDLYA
jgi:hypothetical protein